MKALSKRFILIISVILCVVIISSCGKLENGTIIDKFATVEDDDSGLALYPVQSGNSTTYIPSGMLFPSNEDIEYCVEIEGIVKGKKITEIYHVSYKKYKLLQIKDKISVKDNFTYDSEQHPKRLRIKNGIIK